MFNYNGKRCIDYPRVSEEYSDDAYYDWLQKEGVHEAARELGDDVYLYEVYQDHPSKTKAGKHEWKLLPSGEPDGAGDLGWWAIVPGSVADAFETEFDTFEHGYHPIVDDSVCPDCGVRTRCGCGRHL